MSGEERGKKTIVEIIKMYSPRPTSGYDNSWIKGAMQAYADQQSAALKAALAELIKHSISLCEMLSETDLQGYRKEVKASIDRAKKLLSDKTE